MQFRLLPVAANAALFAALCVASGCASRGPSAAVAPQSEPPPKPVATGKTNRFQMTQGGRRMTADDFDAWMKARGIRVAKGAPAAKPRSKARPNTAGSAPAKPKPVDRR